jgi:hypothetical protein
VLDNPTLLTDENAEFYMDIWGAHSIPDSVVGGQRSSSDRGCDFDGILAVVTRLKKDLGVQVDAASSTSLSREAFSATFQDSQGNLYRYKPSTKTVPHSQRGKEAHRHHDPVQYDSVFLILMLLWEQLRLEYRKPDRWVAGKNNGYDSPTVFAGKWSAKFFAPFIRGLSKEHYQVVDVVELAWSIHMCLQWKGDKDKTGYFSWLGFSLKDFDSKVVGAKVAKLAFQYLPSLPFL